MSYKQQEFKATDWSSPTRKNTTEDHGGIEVGYNHTNGDFGEVLFVIDQPKGTIPMVVLDKEQAMALLHHLNDLMGKPLGYAPSAG